ncbi:MAG: isochorismatase family protein [bacterium]|nr:isochorismatase family protein [bacterium]
MSNPNNIPDRLVPERCILVVVDMQERFRDLIYDIDKVMAGSSRLIQFCQAVNIPILVSEHYSRGFGVTVTELRNLFKPLKPLEKIHFSCQANENFAKALKDSGRDQIILCGIETHVCIYQTAADLLRDGKQVAVAVDAVSSCSAANRQIGLHRLSEMGVQSMGVQMLMFELLHKAGTSEFKEVSGLLRGS